MSTNPASFAAAVTPSDTTVFPIPTRGLYIGGAGSIAVAMVGVDPTTSSVTFAAISAGAILPVCVTKVYATGTDATDIVRLW